MRRVLLDAAVGVAGVASFGCLAHRASSGANSNSTCKGEESS